MRFSSRIIGIAAAAALAAGLATADRANAGIPSGTQIEYGDSTPTAAAYATFGYWRSYAVVLLFTVV